MKKLIFVLFVIAVFAMGLTAYAEDDVSARRIMPDPDYYVDLESPLLGAYNGEYEAYFDAKGITIKSSSGLSTYSLPTGRTPKSAHVSENLLVYTLFDNASHEYSIHTLDLDTGEEVAYDFGSDIGTDYSPEAVFGYSNTFYVYNGYRTLHAYSYSQGMVTYIGNVTKPSFQGANSLSANDDRIVFSKESTLYRYDVTDGTLTSIGTTSPGVKLGLTATTLYTLSSTTLTAIPLEEGERDSITLDAVPDSFAVANGRLYMTYTDKHSIEMLSITDYKLVGVLTKKGAYLSTFTNPMDVATHGDRIYIADTKNDRIKVYTDSYAYLSSYECLSPTLVTAHDEHLYALSAGALIGINTSDGTQTTITSPQTSMGIVSVATDNEGTLYALDRINHCIWKKPTSSDTLTRFKTCDSLSNTPISIAISEEGSTVYAAYADRLEMLSRNGDVLMNVSYDQTSLYDKTILKLRADYYGNLFVLYTDGAEYRMLRLLHTLTDFTSKEDYVPVTEEGARICSFGFAPDGGIVLLSNDTNSVYLVSAADAKAVTSVNAAPVTPPIDTTLREPVADILPILKASEDTLLYSMPGNFEQSVSIRSDEMLLSLGSDPMHPEYTYVLYEGRLSGYVNSSDVTEVSLDTPYNSSAMVLFRTMLYKYPVDSDVYALSTIDRATELTVLNGVGGYDGGRWSAVRYGEDVYYVLNSCLGEKPDTPPTSRIYAKVVTDSIGVGIKLYSRADVSSGVLATLTDGTEVQLYAEIDEADTFTKVRYGDHVGYVYTTNLTKAVLTKAQITAMVLLTIAVAITITIFMINRRMRRHE